MFLLFRRKSGRGEDGNASGAYAPLHYLHRQLHYPLLKLLQPLHQLYLHPCLQNSELQSHPSYQSPVKKRVRKPEKEEIFGSLWRIMMIKEVGCRDAPSKKMKTMKRHRRTIIPARSTLILIIFDDQSLIWQEFQN